MRLLLQSAEVSDGEREDDDISEAVFEDVMDNTFLRQVAHSAGTGKQSYAQIFRVGLYMSIEAYSDIF